MGFCVPAFGEESISNIRAYKNNNPDPGFIDVKTICKEANNSGRCDCTFNISYYDDSIHTRGMNKTPYSVVGSLNSTGKVQFTATFTDGLMLDNYIITGKVTIPKCDPQPLTTQLVPISNLITYGKSDFIEIQSKVSRTGTWKVSTTSYTDSQKVEKVSDVLETKTWVTISKFLPNLD